MKNHRFDSICPYFAMFPAAFARKWISKCTKPGEIVADPFSGRGTAPFQAVMMKRGAIAGDVNPVAYVLTSAKIDSPAKASITRRLRALEDSFDDSRWDEAAAALPPFFRRAFHHSTLRQVIYLRENLVWKSSRVDRFIAALALGSLHGEMFSSKSYFSNQMPRTISTKPDYSVRFWESRRLWPQKRDVFAILRQRTAFRFESTPPEKRGEAFLCDVREIGATATESRHKVNCIVTSPPYLDVTNFEEDQWLRLWLLGGCEKPTTGIYSRDDRHERHDAYWSFLCDAWRGLRPLLADKCHFVCRIGGKKLNTETAKSALDASMQFLADRWKLLDFEVSQLQRRQTETFRPGSVGCRFELDFHFVLRQ
jgi:hypothetical protein